MERQGRINIEAIVDRLSQQLNLKRARLLEAHIVDIYGCFEEVIGPFYDPARKYPDIAFGQEGSGAPWEQNFRKEDVGEPIIGYVHLLNSVNEILKENETHEVWPYPYRLFLAEYNGEPLVYMVNTRTEAWLPLLKCREDGRQTMGEFFQAFDRTYNEFLRLKQ